MSEVFANNATATLGSAVGTGDTTITLATGEGDLFPVITTGQWFSVTIFAAGSATGTPNEIAYCTARTGDTLTVTRGRETTTARSWAVGDTIANYPTAYFYNNVPDVSDLQSQATNSANDIGTANAGIVTLVPVPASLANLYLAPIRIEKMSSTNSGAYTLNVNGLGVKNVVLSGNPLLAGQLPASQVFEVAWDGTSFELTSNPGYVGNPSLYPMPAGTVKANDTGGTASPQDIPYATFRASIGAQPIASNSGAGQFSSLIPNLGAGTITVPAGGTWQWFFVNNGSSGQGISAGGTVVFTGSINNFGSWCSRLF